MKLIATAFALLASLGISPAFAGATINVKLWDKGEMNPEAMLGMGMHANIDKAMMGIDMHKTDVVAGPITFHVRNSSNQTVAVPVDNADAKLPCGPGPLHEKHVEDLRGH